MSGQTVNSSGVADAMNLTHIASTVAWIDGEVLCAKNTVFWPLLSSSGNKQINCDWYLYRGISEF
jgi:hypothetical protein